MGFTNFCFSAKISRGFTGSSREMKHTQIINYHCSTCVAALDSEHRGSKKLNGCHHLDLQWLSPSFLYEEPCPTTLRINLTALSQQDDSMLDLHKIIFGQGKVR